MKYKKDYSTCEKCGEYYLLEHLKKGTITNKYLCPNCYKNNKAKIVLCIIVGTTFITVIIKYLFTG